ncbi:MAG: ISAzo13 family transposase [Planctomycetes bacterium]|nr:ISAzo13 family transposase [Planctomycetota bacterium]
MGNTSHIESIRRKFQSLSPVIDERSRRHWAAVEAIELGWGGVTAVALATGLSRTTITTGIREMRSREGVAFPRIRRPGGGRKRVVELDADLLVALEGLLDPVDETGAYSRASIPLERESPFRWTCKSTRRLAGELDDLGHHVSERTVAVLLRDLGYSLQPSRRVHLEVTPVDRKAQLERVHVQVTQLLARGVPVVALQMKRKQAGQGSTGTQLEGEAIERLNNQQGWEAAFIDHETALFAGRSIRRWWAEMGADRFPWAREMLIAADGAQSPRSRLWRTGLQELANTTGIRLHICHVPPCTFKWNHFEQRLSCFLVEDWRGRHYAKRQAVVSLVTNAAPSNLLERAALDSSATDFCAASRQTIKLEGELAKRANFESKGEWNYTIAPRPQSAVS